MKSCALPECPRPLKARGMCNTHYENWRRNQANPTDLRQHRKPGLGEREMIDHILSRSEPDGACMVWQGARNNTGYGSLGYQGRIWTVHTLMLTLTAGPRPEGMEGCHSRACVSRCCVNPDHLRWDSRSRNNIDTRALGRVGGQKLTRSQAAQIRVLHQDGATAAAIGERFGVGANHVRKIVRGEIWA